MVTGTEQALIQTTFLLITFRNRQRCHRRTVNGMQHILGIGRTGRYSIYSVYFTSETGIVVRAGTAETVVTDKEGLWTFIPK